jgi:hypothetical protein
MNYEQAIVIRTMQLNGKQVGPALLAEAIEVIKATRTPTRGPRAGEKDRSKADGGEGEQG